MAEFSHRLKELRQEKGISQKDLAEELGMARTTIANYEQDTRFPDQRTLCKIADFFNISLDYLLGRIDVPINAQSSSSDNLLDITQFTEDNSYIDLANEYMENLLSGKTDLAAEIVFDSIKKGISVKDIYQDIFTPTLRQIGTLWETNQINVADEHFFTSATRTIMSQLTPYFSSQYKEDYTLLATSVNGELHDIGLRMVSDFLKLEGWDIFYLGANTPTGSIINSLKKKEIDLLAISCSISYNVEGVRNLINAVQSANLNRKVKVMVGGYVFNMNPGLWKEVGADGFARNAEDAVELARELVK